MLKMISYVIADHHIVEHNFCWRNGNFRSHFKSPRQDLVRPSEGSADAGLDWITFLQD